MPPYKQQRFTCLSHFVGLCIRFPNVRETFVYRENMQKFLELPCFPTSPIEPNVLESSRSVADITRADQSDREFVTRRQTDICRLVYILADVRHFVTLGYLSVCIILTTVVHNSVTMPSLSCNLYKHSD